MSDDLLFGIGYSSLGIVQRLPIDILKLDRSFVEGLEAGSKSAVLVTNLTKMAQALNVEVIAEGVETSSEAEFLKKAGVTSAQGYLFSRPLELGELVSWLKNVQPAGLVAA